MRKSTIATLIGSILLIVLGFVLVACGIAASFDTVEYHFGRTVYFQSSYVNYSLQSKLLTSFGQMSFIMGIAGIFLFAFLAIKNPKAAGEKKQGPRQDSSTTVHYEDMSKEKAPEKEAAAPQETAEPAEATETVEPVPERETTAEPETV